MARSKGKVGRWFAEAGRTSALALARGTALFVGAYSIANLIAAARSSSASQNLWWIDTSFLAAPIATALVGASAVVLVAYAVSPRVSAWRSALTVLACVLLAAAALQNTAEFYRAWGAGTFKPGVAFPLSLLIAVVFGLLGWAVLALRPGKPGVGDQVAALLALVLVIAVFPLAQIGFFGTSDYRAKADSAVVFGAMVYNDGTPSSSLRDRIVTAVDLYKTGLVHRLVMSGGVEPNGYDETAVMRDAAIKDGVPASAIEVDPKGVNTDATVANTTKIFKRDGISRVLAVSQGYHLPRVKLAYMAAGWNVRTVPAGQLEPIYQTPLFIAREVPAFWEYWLRDFWRDVRGA